MRINHFTLGNRLLYALNNKLSNFFYKKNDLEDSFYRKFYSDGYCNLTLNEFSTLDLIRSEIKKQKIHKSEKIYNYIITNDLKNLLEKLFLEQKTFIEKLKKYFSCPVVISNVEIKRTMHFDKNLNENINKNIYSENFHIDKYLNTHVKQFIYLSDVDSNCGPFTFMNKFKTKKFIKEFNFKDRFSLNVSDQKNYKYDKFEKQFLGKFGSSMLINTTECIHRAGIPAKGKYRDIITITYVAIPSNKYNNELYFLKDLNTDFFKLNNKISMKFAKPSTKKELILHILRYLKYTITKK